MVVAREDGLDSLSQATARHVALLRHMVTVGAGWARRQVDEAPGVAPSFALGFHAAPSMRQLHVHLISLDLASPCLKNKKHWNSFATPFLVHPEAIVRQLEGPPTGRVPGGRQVREAEEAKLKEDMRCPVSGAPLRNMNDVRARVASAAYADGVRALANGAAVVPRWPAC